MNIKRMWIDQPSTLQQFHSLHGENVLAYQHSDRVMRVYFLSGDVISQNMPVECLSEGWKHQHTCPQCGVTLTCNNPVDCPGAGKPALCGACPDETNADMWKRSNS